MVNYWGDWWLAAGIIELLGEFRRFCNVVHKTNS